MLRSGLLCVLLVYMISGQLNKQMAGPYDLILHTLGSCQEPGERALLMQLKLKKFNRTTIALDGDISISSPLTDDMSIKVTLDQFTNGGWKENFFNKEFPHLCTVGRTYGKKLFTRLLVSARGSDECPIPSGNYSLRNFVILLDNPEIPVFFYNKYRYKVTVFDKDTQIACIAAEADIVPKKRNG